LTCLWLSIICFIPYLCFSIFLSFCFPPLLCLYVCIVIFHVSRSTFYTILTSFDIHSLLLVQLSGAGTAYPSGAPGFTLGFWWGSCYSIFSFICMFCWSLFVLLYFFLLAFVLSVLLRYTDSDWSFGIFKLILHHHNFLSHQ